MVVGIVLAAGASTRFGSPKQRLLVGDVVARARASEALDDLLVVVGAHEVETDARIVPCAEWERGPGASLRCGFAAAEPSAEAAVVLLADGPDLAPGAIDRVVGSWRAGAGPVLAASYGGGRSHPVVLDRSVWSSVPDAGARALEAVLVDCDDLRAPGDVDLPGDLPGRFRSRNGGVA